LAALARAEATNARRLSTTSLERPVVPDVGTIASGVLGSISGGGSSRALEVDASGGKEPGTVIEIDASVSGSISARACARAASSARSAAGMRGPSTSTGTPYAMHACKVSRVASVGRTTTARGEPGTSNPRSASRPAQRRVRSASSA
jgi:hypothetical protein